MQTPTTSFNTSGTSSNVTPSLFSDPQGTKLAKSSKGSSKQTSLSDRLEPTSSSSSGSTPNPLASKVPPPFPSLIDKKRKEAEVVDDDEDEIQVMQPSIRGKTFAEKRHPEDNDIVVEEVVDEEELDEDEQDQQEAEDNGHFSRSASPGLTTPSPEKEHHRHKSPVEHATSIEEVDQSARSPEKTSSARATSPEKTSNGASLSSGHSRGGSRFGGTLSIPNGIHSSASFKAASSPVIPSPLRLMSLPPEDEFSLDAQHDKDEDADMEEKPAPKKIPAPKFNSFVVPALPTASTSSSSAASEPGDAHQRALTLTEDDLPVYSLASSSAQAAHGGDDSEARAMVQALSSDYLPSFSLGDSPPQGSTPKSIPVGAVFIPPLMPKTFDWGASGMKPPSSTNEWTCSLCSCTNKFDHNKCLICDAERPKFSASTETSTKAPTSTVVPTTTNKLVRGFDWSAAGMKPPAAATGTWSCDVCMIQNSSTASKCVACDTPKPSGGGGASSSSATPAFGGSSVPAVSASPPGPPPPPPGVIMGFDWSAAGSKPLASNPGDWVCSTCMVNNTASANRCVACDTSR